MHIIIFFVCTFTILRSSQAAADKDLYGPVRGFSLGDQHTPLLTMSGGWLRFVWDNQAGAGSRRWGDTALSPAHKQDGQNRVSEWPLGALCAAPWKQRASVITNPEPVREPELVTVGLWGRTCRKPKDMLRYKRLLLILLLLFPLEMGCQLWEA